MSIAIVERAIYAAICGDSFEILPQLPRKFALGVYSPPYNINMAYDLYNDSRPLQEYIDWLKRLFHRVSEVVVPGGHIIINLPFDSRLEDEVQPTFVNFLYEIRQELKWIESEWHYKGKHIWIKGGRNKSTSAFGSSGNKPYPLNSEEILLVFRNGRENRGGRTGGTPTSEFVYDMTHPWVVNESEKRGNAKLHPALFPYPLPEKAIKHYSYPGEWIIDPCGGLGTTALAAIRQGRNGVSLDISPDYTTEAIKVLSRGLRGVRPRKWTPEQMLEIASTPIGTAQKYASIARGF